jgi:ParB family chromosome partitioning protein
LRSSDKKPKLTSYDDIFSTEESRQQEHIQWTSLRELHPFKNHPFRVLDDDRMMETVESVKAYGVLVPIIARPSEDGYEIVSGHRRKRACELAGLDEIPVIVRNLDDDEAVIIMVDSNLQRENILPSERAKAYQMKLEAIKRQTARGRPVGDNSRQVGENYSVSKVAEDLGESERQVQRFIRLNQLEQTLMDKVDSGKLAFTPAVELSYLKPEEQQWLDAALEETQQTPSLSQAQRMKRESKQGTLSAESMMEIMRENKQTIPSRGSVILPQDRLLKYFPRTYTAEQIEKTIYKLLDAWVKKRQQTQER